MKTPQSVARLDVGPAGPACETSSDTFTASAALPRATPLLSDHTTLRVGGPGQRVVVATTTDDLVAAVSGADAAGTPVLVVGGGSNLVVADEGFAGLVVLVATRGVRYETSSCAGTYLTAQAGEPWDDLVASTVARDWMGLECLSGIPGLVGSTPIQNVGAYGSEVSQTIASVRTYDRHDRQIHTYFASDCAFGYRTSLFKQSPDRYVVLEVSYQLDWADLSAPIAYPELARRLGVEVGQRAPLRAVRETVLAIRGEKGMVLDPSDHDTWSAGSFFVNPILSADDAKALPPDAPRFPVGPDRVKTSAAWLIDHAGFGRGYGTGRATLSKRHVLAITNRGQATTGDVLALADEVRQGVWSRFGIALEPEPVLVGCSLPALALRGSGDPVG